MESRFNKKKKVFGCVSLSGDMSCVGVDRSRTIAIFLLLSQTYVLGNVRSELFLVYGCRLFMFFFVLFLFFTTDIYTFIYFTLFLKEFFI